MPLKFY